MLDLAILSVFGFSGYAALLATAPLWAVHGGATAAGSGLVNGVLLAFDGVGPAGRARSLAAGYGSGAGGRAVVPGCARAGVPAVRWARLVAGAVGGARSGVRHPHRGRGPPWSRIWRRPGVGVPRSGSTGWRSRCPTWCCCRGRVPVADRWGFEPIFWVAALPVLGVPFAVRLARGAGRDADRVGGLFRTPRVSGGAVGSAGDRGADGGAVQCHHGWGWGAHLGAAAQRLAPPRWCC